MDKPIDFSRMPDAAPPDDLWPAIAGELDRSKRHRLTKRLSALAAMVTVAVLATVLVDGPSPSRPEPMAGGPSVEADATGEVTLAELRATSAWLEDRLSEQRRRPVGGQEVESLMWLEAELAWLDEQLAEAPRDRELWRQRVVLLDELNRRYAGGDWRREMLLASV